MHRRSPYFVTRARARVNARAGREKRQKKRRKKRKRKRRRKIFARTTSGDDLREQIDRDAFAMRSYAYYMLRVRRRKRKRKKEKKWPCSLLVEAKALYEKSRFHRQMLLMIVTFSRERKE
jgi:hypothetical protein